MDIYAIIRLKWTIGIVIICISIFPVHIYAQEINTLPYKTQGYTKYFFYSKEDTTHIFKLLDSAVKMGITSDSAVLLINDALRESEKIGLNDGIGHAYLDLGASAITKGDFDRGTGFLQKALPYCEKAAFHEYLPAMLYNTLATAYMYKDNRKVAIYYYYKALECNNRKNIKRTDILSNIYSNLGIAWMNEKQYDQAIYYVNRGINVALKNKDFTRIANGYSVLGGIYIQKGDTVPGRKYSQMSLEMGRRYLGKFDNKVVQYCAFVNLGISYQHQDPARALYYYKKVLDVGYISPYYSNINPYTGIGSIYSNLKRYKLAEKYLQMALKNALAAKMPNNVKDASGLLAATYELDGNYKKAYQYLQLYSTTADSLMDSIHVIANHELEVKFRTSEKDKEIVSEKLQIIRQKNLVQQKNTWIIGITLGCLLILVSSATIYLVNKHSQHLQEEKIKNLQQEQKIVYLKALIKGEEKERTRIARELHDGVGSLLSAFTISFQALGKENSNIANTPNYMNSNNLLKQISAEIHEAAYNFTPEVLLHNSLVEAIRMYCDYIQFPKSRNIEIDVTSYGNFELLEHEFKLSIYRIIQELLQNIIKHAHATHVIVQLMMQNTMLNITVEDNGVGFEIGRNDNGLGILNLQSRIRSMEGTISIESSPGNGTSVFIEFDLKVHKQFASL